MFIASRKNPGGDENSSAISRKIVCFFNLQLIPVAPVCVQYCSQYGRNLPQNSVFSRAPLKKNSVPSWTKGGVNPR